MTFSVRPLRGVVLTMLATAGVVLVRLALAPILGDDLPLLPFMLSILFAGWLGGLRLALFAIALGWIAGHYFFVDRAFPFGALHSVGRLKLAIFVVGNGSLAWLVSSFTEARRRAAVERARLEKSEAFHAAIADITTDFAFEARVEPDGRVVPESVTEGFAKLFGSTVQEPGARDRVRGLFDPGDAARLGAHVERLLAGETLTGEVRVTAADGRMAWLAYRNRPVRDASGRVVRIYGAARDVTREKEAEAARAEAAAEARDQTERLEDALSTGRMVAWDYDVATRAVVRAESARTLLGIGSTPIDAFYAIVHPDDVATVRERLERAAAGEIDYECEYRIVGPDGATLWFSDRAKLRRDESGRPTHLTGIAVDITARRRAEETLRQREAQLRLALAAADMIGFQWDIPTGRVTRLGEAPGAPLGQVYTMDDIAGRVHPEDRPGWQARLDATLAGPDDLFTSEHRIRDEEGRWRWLRVRGRIERARDGTPRTMLGLGIDVTPQREMQEALREADRRKDEFLATLAHELRNPLAPLRNGLQALEMDDSQSPTTRRIHEMMGRQVDQMVHLVDDLLEVSRITRGRVELRRRIVALRTIVEHAVETSRPLVEAGRHQLEIDVPEAPLWVDADPVRLAQVFANLLNNSARYTPAGGRIALAARHEGDGVVVTVRDTGIGIPSEAHSKGRGLGTEFVVQLPLAASEHAAEAEHGSAPAPDQVPRLRIVTVDDNHDAADTLALLLGRLGADVAVAYDGESALEAIRAERPRLALVDLGMPVVDGFEVARRVREDPALDGVTLVALSGWGQEPDRRRSRAAGFDHHLVKPVDFDALRALLASLA